jgi:cell division initiation protein
MRITPLDVRKQEFKRGMRGYDNDEVRAFLTNVADEYEAVLVDNKQLRERILEQDEKLTEFRSMEKALRDTLMTAEKVMQESKENARRQGEIVISEARQRAQETLAEGRSRLEELRREALAVHREKDTFLARFRSLAESQIQFCEAHRHDFRDLDGRLLERQGASSQPGAQLTDAAGQHAPSSPADTSQNDSWRDYRAGPEAVRQATPADAQSIAEAVQTVENRPIVAHQPYAAVDLDQVG